MFTGSSTLFSVFLISDLTSSFWNEFFSDTYSWPHLVWPNTEELFSQLLVGENRFRLVVPNRMNAKNAIGCLFFHSHLLFSSSFSTVSHSFLGSMVLSNKDLFQNGQIGFVTSIILHFSCISCPIEQRKLCETVGGEIKSRCE